MGVGADRTAQHRGVLGDRTDARAYADEEWRRDDRVESPAHPGGWRVAIGVALATFVVAYDGGSYALASRGTAAIVALWIVALAAVVGFWPLLRWRRGVLVAGIFLGALAVFTALSALWAPSSEKAVNEANRVVLYLAVFALVALASRRGSAPAWSSGLAAGICGVALLALASRLFPGGFPEPEIARFLPDATYRLSFPLNYWNGLAVFCALALPLLLAVAVRARAPVAAGAALAAVPALAGVIYLTSSRGGVLTALVAVGLFLVLTHRRWAAAAATALGGLGAGLVVTVLRARPELVGEPAPPSVVAAEGRTAAILIAATCLACGVVFGAFTSFRLRIRVPRALSAVAVALVAGVLVVGVARLDPVERFEAFKAVPAELERPQSGTTETHLTSVSGNGRWQMWTSAFEQFRVEPLKGQGAGSFEYWWARNGTLPSFVLDAHSLYFETLGELGLIGFLLLIGFLGTGVAVGGARLLRSEGPERITMAALLAAFVAFCVEAGFDWMWELPAVALVGVALAALLVGPASARPGRRRLRPSPLRVRAVVAAAAVVLVAPQAVPLLADARLRESRAHAEQGDLGAAMRAARQAHGLQSWAASPALQLALLSEQAGELDFAAVWIEHAIARDEQNWRLWLVAARIETKAGRFDAARASLDRAIELNPRSPVLARLR